MKRIIVVSENFEICEKVLRICKERKDVKLLKICSDAETALQFASACQPDLMIIDFFLFGMDGFDFLEQTKNEMFEKILLVPQNFDQLNKKAISLGASLVVCCDFSSKDFDNMLKKSDVNKLMHGYGKSYSTENIEEVVSKFCFSIGIPAHVFGYKYIREAIKLTVADPALTNKVTKELYPSVAKCFNSSASRVERAIRHALDIAYKSGKMKNMNSILEEKVFDSGERLTSSQFISMVTDRLLYAKLSA